ncbi:MAG: shikimate dehydrogenase [Nocardiopsaceae bacterium]|jgi:shikimate dehydrogenase|nr:shikimate dehydrogenase [Nocardiopsaceae bacterium]
MRAAVLGSPIGHSLSPILHSAAYAALGLTWWRYEAIECDEAGLSPLLDRCGPDWVGLSLTMPLKRTVLPLLDRIDPLVADVGAANTVLFAAEQRLGYNTDVPGMVRALAGNGVGAPTAGTAPRDARQGTSAQVGPAIVLGAGATACAAIAALRDLGEREIAVALREPARAADLIAAAERLRVTVQLRPFEAASLTGARLIISTVPAAAADRIASAIGDLRPVPEVVFDVSYDPWPSALGLAAEQTGAMVVDGFELLLQQAALQVELMTGRPAPLDEMREAGRAELGRRARQASAAGG